VSQAPKHWSYERSRSLREHAAAVTASKQALSLMRRPRTFTGPRMPVRIRAFTCERNSGCQRAAERPERVPPPRRGPTNGEPRPARRGRRREQRVDDGVDGDVGHEVAGDGVGQRQRRGHQRSGENRSDTARHQCAGAALGYAEYGLAAPRGCPQSQIISVAKSIMAWKDSAVLS
jgi:hypothetical protein